MKCIKEITRAAKLMETFFFALRCNFARTSCVHTEFNATSERSNFMKDSVNCVPLGCEAITKLGRFVTVFKIYEQGRSLVLTSKFPDLKLSA